MKNYIITCEEDAEGTLLLINDGDTDIFYIGVDSSVKLIEVDTCKIIEEINLKEFNGSVERASIELMKRHNILEPSEEIMEDFLLGNKYKVEELV